ncbi:MAG: hypothetical protein AAB275_06530 [Deltaproteobacteria bacterium]
MNKFVCPNCSKISYTADTSQAQKCPHCVEKHVIVNSDIMELLTSYNSGELKLTVNRRRVDRRAAALPIAINNRRSERRENCITPIGWLAIRHPSMTA